MGSEEKGHSEGDVIAEKFRVVRRLGAGGMGEVYEAEHMLTHKRVALKIMLLGRVADGDSAKERFMREARAACAIRHPAIVPVHDVLFMGERMVIVMDLLKGKDLFAIIERRRIHYVEAIEHILPIASALGELHAAGFIHRDIKPENIFVADSGAYLLDLGIVKDTRANAARITSNDPIGTPMYMSPEQAFGQPVDHRADIWSLGLVLYEALSGVAPTEADAMGKIFELIRNANFPPIRQSAPEVPEELDAFVHQMLDRHATRRPAGMHVVYDMLSRYASSTLLARYPRPGPPPDVEDDFRHRVTRPSDAGAVEAHSAERPILRLSNSLPGVPAQRAPTGSPVTTPAPSAIAKPKAGALPVAMISLLGLSLLGAVAYLGITFVREGARQPETSAVATDATSAPVASDPRNLLQDGPSVAPSSLSIASLLAEEPSSSTSGSAIASEVASASASPAGGAHRPPSGRTSTARTATVAAPPKTTPPPPPPSSSTPKPKPSIDLIFKN